MSLIGAGQDHMRDRIWLLIKIALAILLAGLVFSQTSFSDIASVWDRAQVIWLLPSILIFYVNVAILAARAWFLIGRRTSYGAILVLTIIQTAIGNLFATSAGAASFVTMLRVRYQISIARGISLFVFTKFGDLVALSIVLTIGARLVWDQIGPLQTLIIAILALLFLMCLLLVVMIMLRQRFAQFLRRIAEAIRLSTWGPVRHGLDLVDRLVNEDLEAMQRLILPLMAYSMLNVLCSAGFIFCSAHLLGLSLDIASTAFFNSLLQLIYWIPVQVFGGLGTYEVASAPVLRLLVADTREVIPYLLSSRIFFYLLNLLMLPFLFGAHRHERIEETVDAATH
jgi:uncharacterized membrane protein YbhN (UPF0104 family)